MRKFTIVLIFAVIAIIIAFVLQKTGLIETMTPEELEAAIEITDVETKWVDKYYQPWPPKLTLVPAISFRVKNISDKTIRYMNFNAVFRFKDDYENLGDAYLAAIRNDPVEPGEKSDVILLKCNYGVEGKSVHDFKTNPGWKPVTVKLFVHSKGSQGFIGEWDISRTIDFKEPEPVGEEAKKKEKKK